MAHADRVPAFYWLRPWGGPDSRHNVACRRSFDLIGRFVRTSLLSSPTGIFVRRRYRAAAAATLRGGSQRRKRAGGPERWWRSASVPISQPRRNRVIKEFSLLWRGLRTRRNFIIKVNLTCLKINVQYLDLFYNVKLFQENVGFHLLSVLNVCTIRRRLFITVYIF